MSLFFTGKDETQVIETTRPSVPNLTIIFFLMENLPLVEVTYFLICSSLNQADRKFKCAQRSKNSFFN